VPRPQAEWSLSPLGYRPGLGPGLIVPTCPPGLPLVMAAAAGIGGPGAITSGRPVRVRFYDPRDRPRFLAGVTRR